MEFTRRKQSYYYLSNNIFNPKTTNQSEKVFCITAVDDIFAICCFETISVHALSLLLTVRRAVALVKEVTGLINFFNLRTSEGQAQAIGLCPRQADLSRAMPSPLLVQKHIQRRVLGLDLNPPPILSCHNLSCWSVVFTHSQFQSSSITVHFLKRPRMFLDTVMS